MSLRITQTNPSKTTTISPSPMLHMNGSTFTTASTSNFIPPRNGRLLHTFLPLSSPFTICSLLYQPPATLLVNQTLDTESNRMKRRMMSQPSLLQHQQRHTLRLSFSNQMDMPFRLYTAGSPSRCREHIGLGMHWQQNCFHMLLEYSHQTSSQ
jgi:hypothetical protein